MQRRVTILILDLDGAIGLQQGLHHLHVTLVGGHLQRSLALVLDVHLPGAHRQPKVHERRTRPGRRRAPGRKTGGGII